MVLASILAPPDQDRDEEVEERAEEDDWARQGGLLLLGEVGVALGERKGLGGVAAHVLEHESDLVLYLSCEVQGQDA